MGIQDVLDDTQIFFRRNLYDSWVYPYLYQRGLAGEIKTALIGYAKPFELKRFLDYRGHSEEDMLAAGVVKLTQEGKLRDLFIDRLTIPIYDNLKGNLIGFTARVNPIHDGKYPKYINSPASEIFSKKDNLYLKPHHLKDPLWRVKKTPILVEGAIDALAIEAANQKLGHNLVAVAPLGTAFTLEQANILLQPGFVMFDGDKAGSEAKIKVFEILHGLGSALDWSVIDLAKDADPGSLNETRNLAGILNTAIKQRENQRDETLLVRQYIASKCVDPPTNTYTAANKASDICEILIPQMKYAQNIEAVGKAISASFEKYLKLDPKTAKAVVSRSIHYNFDPNYQLGNDYDHSGIDFLTTQIASLETEKTINQTTKTEPRLQTMVSVIDAAFPSSNPLTNSQLQTVAANSEAVAQEKIQLQTSR